MPSIATTVSSMTAAPRYEDPDPVPSALPSGGRRYGTVCRSQKPTLKTNRIEASLP